MRAFAASSALLLTLSASAATLNVEVSRNGFTGPIGIAVAPRVEGTLPEWSATKTIAAGKSAVTFPDLAEGLYIVLVSGPQPLQRVSAKTNLGSAGSTVHLAIPPKVKTAVNVTLAGAPLPGAGVGFTHDELRWRMDVETDERGRFAGPIWEPGRYVASVTRGRSAAHYVDVTLSPSPLTVDVPDRHVTGRVLTSDGEPLAGAQVDLRSETTDVTRNVRTESAADGSFEFLGVREGFQTLSARAPSWLYSDAALFELRGTTSRSAELVLTRGEPRSVRVVDARDAAVAGATLLTSCDGHVKSTAVTNAEGRADVAVPARASCALYVQPKDGSLAAGRFEGPGQLLIRVPDGSSSLSLALKSEAGEAFSGLMLLVRIDGTIVPPAIARLFATRGLSLTTDDEGSISLDHIPPGTYEFWPYRTAPEGQLIYEVASEVQAPISIEVRTGENNATVRFKAQ